MFNRKLSRITKIRNFFEVIMNYIEKLNALRISKNLTFRQLGLLCELSESSVKKILSAKCAPLVSSIEKLCAALDISLSELFCPSDEIVLENSLKTTALVSACASLSIEAKNHLLWFANNIRLLSK